MCIRDSFGKERPDVEISLTETGIAQLPGCFERNELDVAFVRRPVDDPTLLTELVLVDEMVAVLPDDHPLAGERSIPLSADVYKRQQYSLWMSRPLEN